MARLLDVPFEIVPTEFGTVQGGNPPTIATDAIRVPGYTTAALKCDSGAGNAASFWRRSVGAGAAFSFVVNRTYFYRWYFCLREAPTGTFGLWDFRTGATGLTGRFYSAGGGEISARYVNSLAVATDGTHAPVVPGRWYRIDISYTTGDGITDGTGAYAFYLDGILISSATGLQLGLAAITSCDIGATAAPGANKVYWIDDFSINDDQGAVQNGIIGDSILRVARPVSDVRRDANWLAGAGSTANLWDAINDAPPNPVALGSATNLTQIKDTVSENTGNYDAAVSSYDEIGIKRIDTIVLTKPIAVLGADSAVSTPGALMCAGNPGAGAETFTEFATAIAGVYPVGWTWRLGAPVYGDITSNFRNSRPRVRIGKRSLSTRAAMCGFLGLLVEFKVGTKTRDIERLGPMDILEIAWTGKPPTSTAQSFYDIPWENMTDRLLEVLSITEGKSDELGITDAGKMSLTLLNADRYLEPEFEGSPYYPNVVPVTPIRYRAVWPMNFVQKAGFSAGSLAGWTNMCTGSGVAAGTFDYALTDQPGAVIGTTGISGTDISRIQSSDSYTAGQPQPYQFIPVLRNQPYVLTAYYYRPLAAPATDTRLGLIAYDKNFNVLSGGNRISVDTAVSGVLMATSGGFAVAAGVIERRGGMYSAGSLPAGTAYVRVDTILTRLTVSATMIASGFQLEPGTVASPYRGEGVYYGQFVGFTDGYPVRRKQYGTEVQVDATDAFALFAERGVSRYFPPASASARISQMLDLIGWYGDWREITAANRMKVVGAHLANSSVINVDTTWSYGAPGVLVIGTEVIPYTARTATSFTVGASPHAAYVGGEGVYVQGTIEVQATTLIQESPLNAMQDAALVNGGQFFITGDGQAAWYSLSLLQIWNGDALVVEALPTLAPGTYGPFSDQPGDKGFIYVGDAGLDYGRDKIHNRIEITPAGAQTAHIAEDVGSQLIYGVQSFPQTLALYYGADADTRAANLLASYKYPRQRFTSLTIDPHRDVTWDGLIWTRVLPTTIGASIRVIAHPEADASSPYYANNVIADKPFFYYRMNEPSGASVADATGNGRTGTIIGTPTYQQPGAISDGDYSLRLDGTGADFIQIPSLGNQTSIVIEGWFYIEGAGSIGSTAFVTLIGQSATRRIMVDTNTNVLRAQMGGSQDAISAGGPYSLGSQSFTFNAWHHVVYWGNGLGTQWMWLDGVVVWADNVGANWTPWPTGVWWIGAYDNPQTNYGFKGRVDEVAVYTDLPNLPTAGVVLPTRAQEVTNHYAAALGKGGSPISQMPVVQGRTVSVSRNKRWQVQWSLAKLLGSA